MEYAISYFHKIQKRPMRIFTINIILFLVVKSMPQGLFAQHHSLFQPYRDSINKSKPPLEISTFNKWPSVANPIITNDGKFASFIVYNQPIGSQTLIIQAIRENWKLEIASIDKSSFTDDSQRAIYINRGDSLCLVSLGTFNIEYIPNVKSFKIFKNDSDEVLVYQLKTPDKQLVFHNLRSGINKTFNSVNQYWLSKDGKNLALNTEFTEERKSYEILKWLKFPDGVLTCVWKGNGMANLIFDEASTQFAFTVSNKSDTLIEKSVWYYREGTEKAILIGDNKTDGIDNNLKLESITSFSKDGQSILLKLNEKDFPKPKNDAVLLDVWSFSDAKIQSQQLDELNPVALDIFGGHGPQSFVAL